MVKPDIDKVEEQATVAFRTYIGSHTIYYMGERVIDSLLYFLKENRNIENEPRDYLSAFSIDNPNMENDRLTLRELYKGFIVSEYTTELAACNCVAIEDEKMEELAQKLINLGVNIYDDIDKIIKKYSYDDMIKMLNPKNIELPKHSGMHQFLVNVLISCLNEYQLIEYRCGKERRINFHLGDYKAFISEINDMNGPILKNTTCMPKKYRDGKVDSLAEKFIEKSMLTVMLAMQKRNSLPGDDKEYVIVAQDILDKETEKILNMRKDELIEVI